MRAAAATTPLTPGGRESDTVAAAKKPSQSSTGRTVRGAAVREAGATQVGADLTTAGWEYAPAPEARDIVRIEDEYGLFIGGEFVPAADGRQLTTINPATEEPLARVAEAGPADVDAAVAAARAAYERTWRDMPGAERAKYLFRIEIGRAHV